MNLSRIKGPVSTIDGTVKLPVSKSIANRLLIIEALRAKQNQFPIDQLPEDVFILQEILLSKNTKLNTHHAGTAYRFLLAFLCIQNGSYILDGSSRMRKRPIGILVDALQLLGADIQYLGEKGFPPVKINGRVLKSNRTSIQLKANISSQFISALMMIGPYVKGGLELDLKGKILSKPYVQMTAELMKDAGAEIRFEVNQIFISEKPYDKPIVRLEKDWSAVPYFLSILLLHNGNQLFFPDLFLKSRQGDSVAALWFQKMGIHSTETKSGTLFRYNKADKINALELNFAGQPDLAPTMTMLCLAAGIKARFSGCDNLNIKESNRLDILRKTVKDCGATLLPADPETELFFNPPDKLLIPPNYIFSTYEDHRLAMSFSLLSSNGRSIVIKDKAVVKKSFPAYWDELKRLGFEIE